MREWTTGGAVARRELLLLLGATVLLLCAGALLPCEMLWLAAAVVEDCWGTPWYATSPYVAPNAAVVSAARARVMRVRRLIPCLVLIGLLLWRSNALNQASGGMLRRD